MYLKKSLRYQGVNRGRTDNTMIKMKRTNKGNNKITELGIILQRESQNS